MTTTIKSKIHGHKGVYLAGEWKDIEDCGKDFNITDGSNTTSSTGCSKNCESCPRSRTKNEAIKADNTYDIIIIGVRLC